MPKLAKKTRDWSAWGRRKLAQAIRALGLPERAAIELSFVGGAKMKALNRAYRGKNAHTDVLSFELPKAFRKQGMFGDVVICLPVARKQAREQGLRLEDELSALLVHGVLHLLGHDHEKGRARALKMAREERRALSKIAPRACDKGLILRNDSGKMRARKLSRKRSRKGPAHGKT